MRTILAAALAGALMACAPAQQEMTQEQVLQRGQYLVASVAGCNDCHTPMTPQGPDMARSLHGAPLGFEPTVAMPWASYAPTLAGGPAGYTDEQFAAFLQTGVRPDGSRPLPPMPPYHLNEEDARAVVAYIKSLPPPATQ